MPIFIVSSHLSLNPRPGIIPMLRIIRLFVIVLVAFAVGYCLRRYFPEAGHNKSLGYCIKYFAAAVALIVAYLVFPVKGQATSN